MVSRYIFLFSSAAYPAAMSKIADVITIDIIGV